jgi:hypothetical protein
MMRPLAAWLPSLPGFEGPKTYAAWPVWHDSTTAEVHFQPMPKKAATRLYHRARDFDRQTKQEGKHGGAVGHSALQVLHTLLFDFLHYGTGRLYPSYAAIARKANVCQRTVATGLARLKAVGILNWVRRCKPSTEGGAFALVQDTNAYAVLPATRWHGYRPPPECPPPARGTWGDHPPLPRALEQAAAAQRQGSDPGTVIHVLASDRSDTLAAALARLGAAVQAANPQ